MRPRRLPFRTVDARVFKKRNSNMRSEICPQATAAGTASAMASAVRLIALPLALSAALTACGPAKPPEGSDAAGEPAPAAVMTATVRAEPVQLWNQFNGRIAAQESVEIRARVAGYIDRVHFREGQPVRKGQLLFSIDARPYQARLASAQAQLQRAKAAAELAATQDRRARDLMVDRAIAAEEADNRAGTLAQARAQVAAAQAAVAAAQLDLGFTEVRAPIAGVAGRALLTTGNLARADETVLVTVVSQNPVYVNFDADEQSLLRGMQNSSATTGEAMVRVGLVSDEGFPHRGRVGFTDNRLDPQTGTVALRASLNNDQGLLKPGMFARVQMQERSSATAVLIDDKAVLTDQSRKYVYVVDAAQRAQRRDLQLGRMVDGKRIVEAGLEPGEQLVVAGMQRIFYPGMPLAPQMLDGQAAGAALPATQTPAQKEQP